MSKTDELKQLIKDKVYIQRKYEDFGLSEDPEGWIFDFRKILMNGVAADLISDIFYDRYKDAYPFQLGTLEIAGVPLVTSLMNKFYAKGHTDINAFFIRKSRKKDALMRMIEGEVRDTEKIILVDDILNSGNSFWRQIEVLDELGYKIDTVWSILRFRDQEMYARFHNRGIQVKSLFSLDDLTDLLGERVKNLPNRKEKPLPMPFTSTWVFKSKDPSFMWVVPKSQPGIDDTKIYFGSDNRTFWALNQADGTVAWEYSVGKHAKKKSIFSNPAIYKDTVVFGSYDGNVYSLDRQTGKPRWTFMEADWVGSSPAVAKELELLFVGLEFGLLKKHGGIVALNANTGKTVWIDRSHAGMTHSSPLYIEGHQEVVIGSNDGKVRLYDARTGEIKWTFTTFGGADKSEVAVSGFGQGDIKESFAFSLEHDYLIFGSIDSFLYILDRRTGHLVKHFKCEFGIYSTPFVYKKRVYYTSLDKHLRCVDLETLEMVFEKNIDGTRIFSSPTVINDRLYVGTNAGRLHELDLETGEQRGYFQALERITNTVIHNPKTEQYFLPTFANEIIALQRVGDRVSDEDTKGSQ